ncbi:MAG: hypothetical protein JNL44_09225 [Gemmatimonadetes bacterium]|nr:hypothetical protein [Gemmatimonadota bacterium]
MRRIGLSLLIAGLGAVVAAYLLFVAGWSRDLAPWLIALGSAGALAGLACLGAARGGRRRTPRLAAAIALAFLAVAGGVLGALALPPPAAGDPLLLGLPRATALLLTFTGAIPLLLLPVAYAFAFDDEVLSASDLDGIRTEAATLRGTNGDA